MANLKEKILVVPGWAHSVKQYGDYAGLNIWFGISENDPSADGKIVVAHSLGVAHVLKNWEEFKNANKLIFVTPVFPIHGIFHLLWDWLRYLFAEGVGMREKIGIHQFICSVYRLRSYFGYDYEAVMNNLPRERITIINGKKDLYLSPDHHCERYKANGFVVIDAENFSHNWTNEYSILVDEMIREDKKIMSV